MEESDQQERDQDMSGRKKRSHACVVCLFCCLFVLFCDGCVVCVWNLQHQSFERETLGTTQPTTQHNTTNNTNRRILQYARIITWANYIILTRYIGYASLLETFCERFLQFPAAATKTVWQKKKQWNDMSPKFFNIKRMALTCKLMARHQVELFRFGIWISEFCQWYRIIWLRYRIKRLLWFVRLT